MSLKLILIWLWTLLRFAATRRPFTVTISELSCYRYAEPLLQVGCHLETINNQTVVDAFVILSQDVKAFKVKASANIKRSNGASMKLFDLTVDGCDTLNTANADNILKISLANIRWSGHLPKRCPIRAMENFTVIRYAVDADILPMYTPELSFVFNISTFIGSTRIAKVVMKGKVEIKRKMF